MGGGVWLDKSITYWVSANGNDENADGTQEKPFKTLSGALLYINQKIYNPNYKVTVDFMTDYTENADQYHNFVRSIAHNVGNFVIQNSLNKDVTIGRCVVYRSATVTFSNIKIHSSGNPCIVVSNLGIVDLANTISFDQTSMDGFIAAYHGGRIIVGSNTVLNLSGKGKGILLSQQGVFEHRNVASTAFTINVKSSLDYLFSASDESSFLSMWDCAINLDENVTVTDKIRLARHSKFISMNKGSDIIPGDGNIVVDETSSFA